MGYVVEGAEGHEGYVTQLFGDGERSTWTSGHGVGVLVGGVEEVRAYADVVAWQVRCDCGWTGSTYPLADEQPGDVDTRWAEPTDAREDTLIDQWRAHVAVYVETARVVDLADRIADLNEQLAQAVKAARGAGVSWTVLGVALRVSRQAAQQRYS